MNDGTYTEFLQRSVLHGFAAMECVCHIANQSQPSIV